MPAKQNIYTYDPVLEVWVPEAGTCASVRLTAVGLVYNGKSRLHWVIIHPSANNALAEITDAIAAGAAVVLDLFFAVRTGFIFTMMPAKRFETGIYLETFTNMTSVVFGYTAD